MASIELKDLTHFTILRPTLLSGLQAPEASDRHLLGKALSNLHTAVLGSGNEAKSQCLQGLYLLRDVPMESLPSGYNTETPCPKEFAEQTDDYMHMRRADSDRPLSVLAASVLHAYYAFLGLDDSFGFDAEDNRLLKEGLLAFTELLHRCAGVDADVIPEVPTQHPNAMDTWAASVNTSIPHDCVLDLWRQSHWMFYVIIQGLILTFDRFADALEREEMASATTELKTAIALMWASGASMKQTASFSHEEYRDVVRPTMALGHELSMISEVNMSGTIAWDHQYLVNNVWRNRLSPNVGKISTELEDVYADFILAYRDGLSKNHKYVCGRFGGEETGSLLVPNVIANDNIHRIELKRLKQLSGT